MRYLSFLVLLLLIFVMVYWNQGMDVGREGMPSPTESISHADAAVNEPVVVQGHLEEPTQGSESKLSFNTDVKIPMSRSRVGQAQPRISRFQVAGDPLKWMREQLVLVDQDSVKPMTRAYVALSYLGAGYDHKTPSKNKQTVVDLLNAIVDEQQEDGSFGQQFNLNRDAVCAMVVSEAYGMTMDRALEPVVQKAVHWIINNRIVGKAWANNPENRIHINMQTSLLCTMALKAAKSSGIKSKVLNTCWDSLKDWIRAADRPLFPLHINLKTGEENGFVPEIYAACMVFLGMRAGDEHLDKAIKETDETAYDDKWPFDSFTTWVRCVALFQYGGDYWKRWGSVRNLVRQKRNCIHMANSGSWELTKGMGIDDKLRTTAIFMLSDEIYYAYRRYSSADYPSHCPRCGKRINDP